MKLKFNWGTGILIACLMFMGITIFTGIKLMNQKVDLVTDNYYEKELKYQDQIDKLNRSEQVKDKVKITYENQSVIIAFTDTSLIKPDNGTIHFYRPSDSAKDFIVPVNLDETGKQRLVTSKMLPGYWKVQLSWKLEEKEYFYEQPVLIN